MSPLDYALLLIVAVSVGLAAWRGLVYELWMMAATVLALGLAAWRYHDLAPRLSWMSDPEAQSFAAFVLILAAVMILAALLGRWLRRAVRAVGLGWFDRFGGASLGLIRGLLLGLALVWMMTAVPWRLDWVRESRLAPAFLMASRAVAVFFPAAARNQLQTGLVHLSRSLP